MSLKNCIIRIIYRLRGMITTEDLISDGLTVGRNFNRMHDVIIDDSHCWLISIGDNVTLAPRVHILAHDASTKILIGYTKIGNVTIGNNVFIGAGTVILPGTEIGDNVIVGAGSVVNGHIDANGVYVGNPCHFICSIQEYINKHKKRMESAPVYSDIYTKRKNVSNKMKEEMRTQLENGIGYVE